MIKIRRPVALSEIPSAAWANLGFLLLIFSISTTLFGGEQGLILPRLREHDATVENDRRKVIVLRTDALNQVTLADEPVVDLDRLSDRMVERLAGNPELVVSIEPDPRSLYKTMIKVLDEVKEAGVTRIVLHTGAGGFPQGSRWKGGSGE